VAIIRGIDIEFSKLTSTLESCCQRIGLAMRKFADHGIEAELGFLLSIFCSGD
jgi:hypothetical protein